MVGLKYRKHENEIDNILANIDFDYMFSCTNKIDGFVKLIDKLDHCAIPSGKRN